MNLVESWLYDRSSYPASGPAIQLGLLSARWWRLSAMIAGVAQFKSQVTARAATRPSSKMAKKMPTASTDVSTLPRRSDFAEGAGGDEEWCREIEKKSDNYGKTLGAVTGAAGQRPLRPGPPLGAPFWVEQGGDDSPRSP